MCRGRQLQNPFLSERRRRKQGEDTASFEFLALFCFRPTGPRSAMFKYTICETSPTAKSNIGVSAVSSTFSNASTMT